MANTVDTNEFKHNPAREDLIHVLEDIIDRGDDVAHDYNVYMDNAEYTRFVSALNILEDLKNDIYLDFMTCGEASAR